MIITNLRLLLNKKLVYILLVVLLLELILFMFNSQAFSSNDSKILYHEKYYASYTYNCLNFLSFIIAFLSIFIASGTKNYDVFFLTSRKREYVILSRLISLYIILFLFVLITFALFLFVPNLLMPYFIIGHELYLSFIYIYIQGIFLITLTALMIEFFETYFVGFLIIVLYWVIKILITDNPKSKAINFLIAFPMTFMNNKGFVSLTNGLFINIFSSLVYLALIVLFYCKKNIKN